MIEKNEVRKGEAERDERKGKMQVGKRERGKKTAKGGDGGNFKIINAMQHTKYKGTQ